MASAIPAQRVVAPVDPLRKYAALKLQRTLTGFPGGAHCLVCSPDGESFAIGTGRGVIQFYSTKTLELQFELLGHADLTMLLRTYFHEDPEAMRKAIEDATK